MKKNLTKILAVSSCMLVMNSAHAYKYVIYTDDNKTDKAEQIAEMMKTTYPFSKFDIEVEIVTLKPSQLSCESAYGIDRLIACDNSNSLQERAMKTGGDQAMILKDSETYGGSSHVGGGVPVITTATSPRAMLHEYMHTLGLCDEYEYKESEAEIYCNPMRAPNPNVVFIAPENPYAGDSRARGKHSAQIPWYSDISSNTPITNTNGTILGTGDVDSSKRAAVNNTNEPQMLGEPTGLYQGKVCNKAFPRPKVSWQPGAGATVMENFNAGLGAPLEKVVEKLLLSRGARLKIQYQDVPPVKPVNEEPASSVVVTPEPFERINNTARTFVKNFFSWGRDLFENVRKVLSR